MTVRTRRITDPDHAALATAVYVELAKGTPPAVIAGNHTMSLARLVRILFVTDQMLLACRLLRLR